MTAVEGLYGKVKASNWVPLAILAFLAPCGMWCAYSLVEGGGSQTVEFGAAAGSFVILAFAYLALRGVRNMGWTSVPVLLTLEALAGYIFIPIWQFATGADALDDSYVHAMVLVLIGFASFWLASILLAREQGVRFFASTRDTPHRTVVIGSTLLVLGFLGKAILWRTGLFAYAADPGLRSSAAGILQWLTLLANLLDFALLVSAVELFSKRSVPQAIRVVFWVSFLLSVGFGVISGMKAELLHPIANVVIVFAITRRRLPRAAVVLPFLLVLVVYPFVNAFRDNLNSGYRAQFNTLGGMEQTLVQSFNDAFLSFGATSGGTRKENLQTATSRVSYLTYVRDVSSLPVPSMLGGGEKVWMAPIYPLVPRFLWPGKPVLNKGQRLSILLGRPDTTSSAPTPIGDMYALYGTYGVVLSMLFWGACLQLYMNWIGSRGVNERGLFIFMLMLTSLLEQEYDFIGLIAAAEQRLIIALVLSYIIYGWSESTARVPKRWSYSPRTKPGSKAFSGGRYERSESES
jgi:hypothetical protein